MVTIVFWLLFYYFQAVLACWGKEDPRFSGNLSDPEKWVHKWEPDKSHSINNYKDWIKEYKKNEAEKAKADEEAAFLAGKNPYASGFEDEGGWPSHWKDIGPGSGGVAPPPWAIEPESHGKPDLCFKEPEVGNCKDKTAMHARHSVRWGFNAYTRQCQMFIYSGCGGNMNNFLTKGRCEEVCSKPPTGTDCFSDVMMDFVKLMDEPFTVPPTTGSPE